MYGKANRSSGNCHYKDNLLLTVLKERGIPHQAGPHREVLGRGRRQQEAKGRHGPEPLSEDRMGRLSKFRV